MHASRFVRNSVQQGFRGHESTVMEIEMNSKELVRKYWFLRRPSDAEAVGFYLPGRTPWEQRGLETGDGWLGILDDLFTKIAEVVRRDKLRAFEIRQIKEKFGTLRVYIGGGNDKIYALIREAEKRASETCEQCGNPKAELRGVENNGERIVGRLATRCDRCEARKRKTESDDDDYERRMRIGEEGDGW